MLPIAAALAGVLSAPPDSASREAEATTSANVGEDMAEAIDAINRCTIAQRADAVREARILVGELDTRIEAREDRLRRQWHRMDEAARHRARTTSTRLIRMRTALAEWHGGLQYGSDRVWHDITAGFADAVSDVLAAWDDARRDIEETP